MRSLLPITKALSDQARLRLLMGLREGELCVCQIVELLELAPSTVSRHLEVLTRAQLVQMRKQGRWHYYRLPGDEAPPEVRGAIAWVLEHGEREPVVVTDADRLCAIRQTNLEELAACQRSNNAG